VCVCVCVCVCIPMPQKTRSRLRYVNEITEVYIMQCPKRRDPV